MEVFVDDHIFLSINGFGQPNAEEFYPWEIPLARIIRITFETKRARQ